MNGQLGRVLKEAGELPTTLSELLDEVEKFLGNFVAYPSADAKIAHVLWVFHTHCMDEWESTPRIVFASAEPGSDLRYAGTFPMRREPGPGEVDPAGELHGHAGLYIVDLSIFPAMGAKHPTLTLMANADRIGRRIAAEA